MDKDANLFEYTAQPADKQRILEMENTLGKSYQTTTGIYFCKQGEEY